MRAAIVYVVVAWAIMEGDELIFTALKLPDWTVTLLVALAILGFPLALDRRQPESQHEPRSC